MGKFVNTQRKDTIDSITSGLKQRLENPYYINNKESPTIVNYYSLNIEQSTLDQGLRTDYEQIGKDSPFKYNLIKNFYLYGGLGQIEITLDVDDVAGLQAEPITGVSDILPNIGMIPSVGDCFEIQYLENTYIFEVNNVNTDKLESLASMYQIEYELTKRTNEEIMKQVAGVFVMDIDNLGTSLRVLVREDVRDLLEIMDDINTRLKDYFSSLFFLPRVETYILETKCGTRFYDPYLINFIINNKLMSGSTNYVYLTQQLSVRRSFPIEYDNTFFRSLEVGSINKLKGNIYGYGLHIQQPTSILSMHQEDYFELIHCKENDVVQNPKFLLFQKDLMKRILSNSLYEMDESVDVPDKFSYYQDTYTQESYYSEVEETDDDKPIDTHRDRKYKSSISIDNPSVNIYRTMNNIIIKYFNDFEITEKDIDTLEDLDYQEANSPYLFYMIPIIIFILEKYMIGYLKAPAK